MGDSEQHCSLADLSSRGEEESNKLEAFVTMITSDDFAIGAEVMLHSLRQHSRTPRPQVVMVTSEVSQIKRRALKSVADDVIEVSFKLQAIGHRHLDDISGILPLPQQ